MAAPVWKGRITAIVIWDTNMEDLKKKPKFRDLISICLEANQTAKQLKIIEAEAKRVYKKMSKSNKKNLFQEGEWEGKRVINFAVIGGHELLLNTLIRFLRVDPKIPDALTNRTPLHFAAEAGKNTMVAALVQDHNCPIDAIDVCGSTPLHFALFRGKGSTMDLLLDCGASTEMQNFFGLPIHYAAYKGYTNAVRRLHGINADSASAVVFGFCTPIRAAVSIGSFDCTKYLAEVTVVNATPLMYTAVACILSEKKALPIIDVLLGSGVDPNLIDEFNAPGFEELPIILAAKRGWKKVVEVLLDATNPIAEVDWSVDSLIGHVGTEAFHDMDLIRRQRRIDRLKRRILEELDNRRYLAAELICLSLQYDMGGETCYSWMCLSRFLSHLAENSSLLGCDKDHILSVGDYCYLNDQLDMAEVAAKAALVLAPEDAQCIRFYGQVKGALEATSSTSSSGRV